MILQQQATTTIRGKANPNKNITLHSSWDNKTYNTKSDKEGNFSISITTTQAGGPYEINISDGENLKIKDILLGELWFCSGQSNMEMPVRGFKGQPIYGSHPYIVNAKESRNIRLFTVKRDWSKTPKDDVSGSWNLNNSKSVSDFSAVGYFFGDYIESSLNVPVGIINCSWSASKIEPWMSEENLKQVSDVDLKILEGSEFKSPNTTPTLLYNAMLYPFEGLAIKGMLWYQGESNSGNPALYKQLFPIFAKEVRTLFNNPTLPIYYVMIAPYQSNNKDDINCALFRQAQIELMDEVPNTGVVITTDLGSEKFIHPPHKIEVGERLAYWALAKTYGKEGFQYSGPIYKDYAMKKDGIEVSFDFGNEGLIPEQEMLEGFEVVDNKGAIFPAQAKIINASNKVNVWSDDIALDKIKEVRYCFRNYKLGSLKNNAGLAAAPFRVEIK